MILQLVLELSVPHAIQIAQHVQLAIMDMKCQAMIPMNVWVRRHFCCIDKENLPMKFISNVLYLYTLYNMIKTYHSKALECYHIQFRTPLIKIYDWKDGTTYYKGKETKAV